MVWLIWVYVMLYQFVAKVVTSVTCRVEMGEREKLDVQNKKDTPRVKNQNLVFQCVKNNQLKSETDNI